jgi:hypothetical protein
LDNKFEHRSQLTSPIEKWQPKEDAVVEVSGIDQLERAYLQEYE